MNKFVRSARRLSTPSARPWLKRSPKPIQASSPRSLNRQVGIKFPDMENASRRIKKSEYEDCAKNGVKDIVEVQVGLDGIAFAEAMNGPGLSLTPLDIYKALAEKPFGKPNTSKTWKDVNPALPALPISVYGPPKTSGTRDALAELILEKGCDTDPAMKALKDSNKDQHKAICTSVRTDGVYVEQGENDNLIVQKLATNSNVVGVFGFSFLEENMDKLKGIAISGVAPTYASISDFSYPGARPLYVYIKAASQVDPRSEGICCGICGGMGPGWLSEEEGNGDFSRRCSRKECRHRQSHVAARPVDPEIDVRGRLSTFLDRSWPLPS